MRCIPKKQAENNLIICLEKNEIDALLDLPDKSTAQGRRDYVLLLLLYNTGVRAEEAASLKVSAFTLPLRKSDKTIPVVSILGKVREIRRYPLWDKTTEALLALIKERKPEEPVFINCLGQSITRFGIYEMSARYGKLI